MKIVSYLSVILLSFFVVSCSKVSDPIKKVGIGNRVISYQPAENVDSLVIPPDLTKPSSQGVFAKEIETNDSTILSKVQNVEVMRDKYRRWLLVDLPPSEVWDLSKEFFRTYGFVIENENQKIGLFETDYLEIETKVPEKSLGAIRAALSKALKTRYGLPIADKYRVRIEPTASPKESEVYLTLSSIGEVPSGAMRLWQPRDKDVELETEMLLKLMVFLGSERNDAINKIETTSDDKSLEVSVVMAESGYATLLFPFDRQESWRYLGWALDELGVDVEDRDALDGSFFIKVEPERGFFTALINTVADVDTYQLILKERDNNQTEMLFVDLSEENTTDTMEFSIELLNRIAEKF